MRPHERLDVWNKAVDFVVRVYQPTEALPKGEEFGLTSQIRRASVPIPANIAEGAARTSPKEFMQSLSNAQGSASELETELLIAHRLGYCRADAYASARSTIDDISRTITGLRRHLRSKPS